MTTTKTRFIQSIIIACLLALASLALTLEVVSASAQPAPALASGQTAPLRQDPVLVAIKTASVYTDTDGDGAPSPGDVLLYEVTIKNNGIVPATGVTFSDNPPYTTLLTGTVQSSRGTVTIGNAPGDTEVFVDVGEIGTILAPPSSVVISFQVTIDNPLPAKATQVENRGVVDCGQLDPFEVQATTGVTAAPALAAGQIRVERGTGK